MIYFFLSGVEFVRISHPLVIRTIAACSVACITKSLAGPKQLGPPEKAP